MNPNFLQFAQRFCLVCFAVIQKTLANLYPTKGDAPVIGPTEASISKTTKTNQ